MRRKLLRTIVRLCLTNIKYLHYMLHDFNHPHHHSLTMVRFLSWCHFLRCGAIFPVCDPVCSAPSSLLCLAPPHISHLISPHQEPDTELIPDNQPQTRPRSVSAFRSNGNWFNQIQISKGWDWFNTPRSVAKCRFLRSSSEVEEITRNILIPLAPSWGRGEKQRREQWGLGIVRGRDQDDTNTMETRGRPDHPDPDWVTRRQSSPAARTNMEDKARYIQNWMQQTNFSQSQFKINYFVSP